VHGISMHVVLTGRLRMISALRLLVGVLILAFALHLPSIVTTYVMTRFLGKLSILYDRAIFEPLVIGEEAAMSVCHYLAKRLMFTELKDAVSGITKARVMNCLDEASQVLQPQPMGPQELEDFKEYCWENLCGHKSPVHSLIGQGTQQQTISMQMYMMASDGASDIQFSSVMDLFQTRTISFLESLFLEPNLRRYIKPLGMRMTIQKIYGNVAAIFDTDRGKSKDEENMDMVAVEAPKASAHQRNSDSEAEERPRYKGGQEMLSAMNVLGFEPSSLSVERKHFDARAKRKIKGVLDTEIPLEDTAETFRDSLEPFENVDGTISAHMAVPKSHDGTPSQGGASRSLATTRVFRDVIFLREEFTKRIDELRVEFEGRLAAEVSSLEERFSEHHGRVPEEAPVASPSASMEIGRLTETNRSAAGFAKISQRIDMLEAGSMADKVVTSRIHDLERKLEATTQNVALRIKELEVKMAMAHTISSNGETPQEIAFKLHASHVLDIDQVADPQADGTMPPQASATARREVIKEPTQDTSVTFNDSQQNPNPAPRSTASDIYHRWFLGAASDRESTQ